MANKEVWISVFIVIVLLALGVFLTQKTTWFESSYNYSDSENFGEFDDFGDGVVMDFPSDSISDAVSGDNTNISNNSSI